MNVSDFILGTIALAGVPLFMAAYGGQLAASDMTRPEARRSAKLVLWISCLVGILIAVIYQYRSNKFEEARAMANAQAELRRDQKLDLARREVEETQTELKVIERSSRIQLETLQRRVQELIQTSSRNNQADSAQELKNEIAELSRQLKPQTPVTLPPPSSPTLPTKSSEGSVQSVQIVTCRVDALKECGDEDLLNWAKPLMKSVGGIVDDNMVKLKSLDDIKGSWVAILWGKDPDSKWLKAYAEAQQSAADQFRDCCAQATLQYYRELSIRTGAGVGQTGLIEWIQKLLQPVGSKPWKQARQEGGSKVVSINGDLVILRINLEQKIRVSGDRARMASSKP